MRPSPWFHRCPVRLCSHCPQHDKLTAHAGPFPSFPVSLSRSSLCFLGPPPKCALGKLYLRLCFQRAPKGRDVENSLLMVNCLRNEGPS